MHRCVVDFQRQLAILLILCLAGIALGQYNSENDIYIQVENETAEQLAVLLGLNDLGELMFAAQEGAHQSITDSSGEEVAHYYIWLCIGSQCVPVDPFEYSR